MINGYKLRAKEQIYSSETGNGQYPRPSWRPVRTATKNDNHLDGRLNDVSRALPASIASACV